MSVLTPNNKATLKMFKLIIKNHLRACLFLSLSAYLAIDMGMFVVPVVIFSSAYYLLKLLIFFITKKPLKVTVINFCLWLFVYGTLAVGHHFVSQAKKSQANTLSIVIEEYFNQHNEYPESLDTIKSQVTAKKHKISYHKGQGEPILYYRSNYNPYDKYSYSFSEKKWHFLKSNR